MARDIIELPFQGDQLAQLKLQVLSWASSFSTCLYLDSREYPDSYGRYECLLGAGAVRVFSGEDRNTLLSVQEFVGKKQDWVFGHLGYELKDVFEPSLQSSKRINFGFRPISFFVPEVVVSIARNSAVLRVESIEQDAAAIAKAILNVPILSQQALPELHFQSRLQQEEYLERITVLKQHIKEGDCYEINFCNEHFAKGTHINPQQVFRKLSETSPAPFSAFYRLKSLFLMCSSPERFLTRKGSKIVSQPIKGTAARSSDSDEDERLKAALFANEKERAENVMIVDLVRNDLARVSEPGTVTVDELFGMYSFPTVHQMVSTVSGQLRADVDFDGILAATFPMGSMTGAPKHRVMQLIEEYELVRRELFSGSVGYMAPNGDFDFNVIIRSLFYNEVNAYLSYQTGGAITWGSVATQEWEEMRLKAAGMERIFAKSS